MNPERLIELTRGYIIFFLCLFIFAMWGINLFSISQTEEKAILEIEGDKELVEVGAPRPISFKPRPFLYYYFLELGFKVATIPGVPSSSRGLLLVIDPPDSLSQEIMREIFQWIRGGGDVIMFLPREHKMDSVLGIYRQQSDLKQPPAVSLYLPFLNEVETISPYATAAARESGMSFFSVFPENLENSPLLFSARGRGRLIIASHKDFLYGEGLMRHDNLVMVTRLVEHLSPDRHFEILDTHPDLVVQSMMRTMLPKSQTVQARVKKDHLTFYSLLKANPISWVLAQMAIALLIFFASTARRFGRPLKMDQTFSGSGPFVKQIGSLLCQNDDQNFALSEILSDFAMLAIRRYGLADKASIKEITAAIRHSNPDIAHSLELCEHEIYKILNGTAPAKGSLLRVARTIEKARKELKLYD